MFTIQEIQHTNPLLTFFQISNSEVSCKIYPNLGASLQQFSIKNIDIIQGLKPEESDLAYYRRYYPSSFLFPFPGRVAGGTYQFQGKEYQLATNEGGRDNAIHGFLAEAPFELINHELNRDAAVLNFQYSYKGNEKGFPFPADVNVIYEISGASLNIKLQITNTGEQSFPFGLGWHPYFLAKNLAESTLSFDSDEQLTVDENQIPIGSEAIRFESTLGTQNLDDTYLLKKSKVSFSTKEYQMEMSTSASKKSFLQLYIPPSRNSVAIEPMTCTPDVFNNKNGLLELAPKEKDHWSINMYFDIMN